MIETDLSAGLDAVYQLECVHEPCDPWSHDWPLDFLMLVNQSATKALVNTWRVTRATKQAKRWSNKCSAMVVWTITPETYATKISPGRYGSSRTSAERQSRLSKSVPSFFFRSNTTDFLPRASRSTSAAWGYQKKWKNRDIFLQVSWTKTTFFFFKECLLRAKPGLPLSDALFSS